MQSHRQDCAYRTQSFISALQRQVKCASKFEVQCTLEQAFHWLHTHQQSLLVHLIPQWGRKYQLCLSNIKFFPPSIIVFWKDSNCKDSESQRRGSIPKLSMFPHSVSACSSAISTCNSYDPETYHSAFPTAWSVTIMLQTKPKHFTLILVGAKLFPGQQPRTLIIFYCFSRGESVWPSHSKQAKQLISLGKAFYSVLEYSIMIRTFTADFVRKEHEPKLLEPLTANPFKNYWRVST